MPSSVQTLHATYLVNTTSDVHQVHAQLPHVDHDLLSMLISSSSAMKWANAAENLLAWNKISSSAEALLTCANCLLHTWAATSQQSVHAVKSPFSRCLLFRVFWLTASNNLDFSLERPELCPVPGSSRVETVFTHECFNGLVEETMSESPEAWRCWFRLLYVVRCFHLYAPKTVCILARRCSSAVNSLTDEIQLATYKNALTCSISGITRRLRCQINVTAFFVTNFLMRERRAWGWNWRMKDGTHFGKSM